MSKYDKLIDVLVFGAKSKSVDEQIWAETIKHQIQTDMESIKSQSYLLGAPISRDIASAYSFFLKEAISKNDHFVNENNSFDSWQKLINVTTQTLKNTLFNFKEGINKGVSLSGIMTKMIVSEILKDAYASNLESYVKKQEKAEHM